MVGIVAFYGVYATVSRRTKDLDPNARQSDESIADWWRRDRLSRDSYDYWLVGGAIGILLLVGELMAGDAGVIGLSLFVCALNLGILLKRWAGKRPPT